MARLIYSAIASLDGYVADESGDFGWCAPGPEAHAFVNDLLRPVETHLYGRRMYEVLRVWERPEDLGDDSPHILDFAAIWQGAEKVVYSRTLEEVPTARTRIEREFDPAAIGAAKADAEGDLSIGGPNLAAQALAAGIVDEVHLFLAPIIVGGGNRALPTGVRLELALRDERRLDDGMAYVGYEVRNR